MCMLIFARVEPESRLFLTLHYYTSLVTHSSQIFTVTFRHNIVMYTATRNGPSTSAPGDGSRTLTITNNPTREENHGDEQGDEPEGGQIIGTLHLRPTRLTGPRVAWDEDVIDNEGFGKKKSKSRNLYFHLSQNFSIEFLIPNCYVLFISVCCIYHKPRRFDESSSSEDSSSDSDSGSCSHHDHDHDHNNNHRLNPSRRGSSSSNPQQAQRTRGTVHEPTILDDTQPNAYETQPESKKGKRKASALSYSVLPPRD
jgi:protein phosphatase 1 regulatory subunit 11